MARYIKNFQTNVDPQKIYYTVNLYMQSEGYEYINYNGENVFKKGIGIMSNPTFLSFLTLITWYEWKHG